MRMCGHAHHDDMLYLGKDPPPSWDYRRCTRAATPTRDLYEFWAARDPIARYAARLEADKVINSGELGRLQNVGRRRWSRPQAQRVVAEPWPEPHEAGVGVFEDEAPRTRVEVLEPARRGNGARARRRCRRSSRACRSTRRAARSSRR